MVAEQITRTRCTRTRTKTKKLNVGEAYEDSRARTDTVNTVIRSLHGRLQPWKQPRRLTSRTNDDIQELVYRSYDIPMPGRAEVTRDTGQPDDTRNYNHR
eukprot:1112919-Amphidinium_carterae.1